MKHDIKRITPPEHSFLDSRGNRYIALDIDIMVKDGMKFYTTFRYLAPVHLDFTLGEWVIDLDRMTESIFCKYPSLEYRKDVRICLNSAKVVKQSYKFQRYEKDRKFHRTSSQTQERCVRVKSR